jgi:hypothetical protein
MVTRFFASGFFHESSFPEALEITLGIFANDISCEYLREFLNKFEMALMEYSVAWGKLIYEKT